MKKNTQNLIKTLALVVVLLGIVGEVAAQKVAIFREGTYLKYDKKSKMFLSKKKDKKVMLKKITTEKKSNYEDHVFGKLKGKLKSYSLKKDSMTYNYEFSPNKGIDSIFNDTTLVNKLRKGKFYGDILQRENVLVFKPWLFKLYPERDTIIFKKDSIFNDYLDSINLKMSIPKRTVVQIKYGAWHYGALSLPVKTYFKSEESIDSLSNFTFGANLGLMIGRKGGKKKYYFNSKESNDSYHALSSSLNFVVGFSELKLNKLNTIVEHDEPLAHDVSILNLSLGLAGGLHYKKIGAYLVLGIDKPLSKKFGNVWKFGKLPFWLGLGFGLNL